MSLTRVTYSMIEGAPVSVLDYGASPSETATNNATAFNAAIAYCVANNLTLVIPDGIYQLPAGTTVNFAGNGLRIIGQGRPTLQYVGAGIAFYCNAGVDGTRVDDMQIENLLIVGNPAVTHGCYLSGVVRSVIRNIEVRECSAYAFNIRWGVSNLYENLKYSASGETTTASTGVYLTNAGTGLYTADCTFINCIAEDFAGNGAVLNDASGNVFIGGTFEACNNGLVVGAASRLNTFTNVWFELNTDKDVEVAGNTNTFIDCNFVSSGSNPSIVVSEGDGNSFAGGYFRTAELQSTSSGTSFYGCSTDQSLSGTTGIQGSGSYKAYGLSKVDDDGAYVDVFPDVLGETGTFTATATGLTTTQTGTVTYQRAGKIVTLSIPFIGGTSNSTAFTLTGLPSVIRPTNTQRATLVVTDNGTQALGLGDVASNGTVTLSKNVSGAAFTASGSKSVEPGTFTYLLA